MRHLLVGGAEDYHRVQAALALICQAMQSPFAATAEASNPRLGGYVLQPLSSKALHDIASTTLAQLERIHARHAASDAERVLPPVDSELQFVATVLENLASGERHSSLALAALRDGGTRCDFLEKLATGTRLGIHPKHAPKLTARTRWPARDRVGTDAHAPVHTSLHTLARRTPNVRFASPILAQCMQRSAGSLRPARYQHNT
jgi:hypothetical protein